MKKIKFAKIVWVTSIFLELIVILVMVMDYKINYQYLEENKLYFYECNGEVCATEVMDDNNSLYSIYDCGQNTCPIYRKEINNSYAVLEFDEVNILYDYRNGKVISQEYEDYQYLNNQYFIVSKNGKQGMINLKNELIINTLYSQLGYVHDEYITGYNLNLILVELDGKYGIVSLKTGEIVFPIEETSKNINKLLDIIKKDSLELNS